MKLRLLLEIEKCSACGACAVACMDQHDIDVEAGVCPLRHIYDVEALGREGPCPACTAMMRPVSRGVPPDA